jgi:two-component system, NtrC family, sensor kinase
MLISQRHRHYLFLAVALILATCVAALGGISFQRKVESFQPVGFEAQKRLGVWLVTAVSHPRTGIRPGDGILSVAEETPATLQQLRHRLRASDTTALLVQRDDELESVLYERPPLEIDVPYLILAVIGAVYLLIGLYTVFKDRQQQARVFLLWCLASLALYLTSPPAVPLDFTDKLIFMVDQLARALVPALTLHLFLVFPRRLFESPWLGRAIPCVYLPSLLSIGFQVDQIYGGGRVFGELSASRLQLVAKLELLFLVASALLAALTLFVRFAQKPAWESRRQMQWILLGLLGGYVPFLSFAVLPWALGLSWPSWTTVLGVLPLGLVPLAFAWAILKYKLLDIGVVLRDSISYSLTVLIGLFGFSLINIAIRHGLAEDLALARNFLTFAAGAVIAGVMVPARGAISSSLERLQFRGSIGPRRDLASLGQELLHERDLDRLCNILIDRLADGLVVRAELYLAQGGAMVPVEAKDGLPRELAFDAFGEELWQRDVESISAVHFPEPEATAEQRLFAAGFRYVFPLVVRDERIGVAVMSYKFDDEPLNSEDLDLARGLLNQAALAIENARLLEEVHRRLVDVTRLEERNHGILESSPAGIAVLDASRRVVSANHAFAVIADRPRPEVVGEPVEELICVGPLPDPGEGLLEVSFCRLSGEERHLQLSLASYRRGDEPSLLVLVVQDVSERVRMEQELREKERLASLGMLAAGVAHEVNTPLTGISSYAQLLLSEVDESDPRHAILKKMERQTFRAAQIVNNLLEFARNRRDQLVPVAIDAVLDECVQLLAERAEASQVEIGWRRPAEPLPVIGHEGELHQVFSNLIVNALDAMSPSGGRLTLAAEAVDSRIRVTVSDTGPGIPPERLDRIFDPFFSSKPGRRNGAGASGSGRAGGAEGSQSGAGLGLAISTNIVRRHAGEIRVENHAERGGCSFIVELPRHGALGVR